MPLNETPVAFEMPGPTSRKSSVAERSLTTMEKEPAARLESELPSAARSEIFAPGPTDARSFVGAGAGVGVGAGGGGVVTGADRERPLHDGLVRVAHGTCTSRPTA